MEKGVHRNIVSLDTSRLKGVPNFPHTGQRHPSIWGSLRHQMDLGGEDIVTRMQARLWAPEHLDALPKV
jgi:hypothetical protein